MDKIRHKILIVDDTPRNLQVLGNTLKEQLYQVEFAIDGEKALNWIQKTDFDLILLDIMMPEMNGYDLCREIRQIPRYKKTPIIFLTAKTDTDSIVTGFEAGAQDYITKPFNTVELLLRVKTQLDLKSGREKLESMNEWLDSEVRKRTRELDGANRELEAANQRLEKTNEELRSLDQAKSDFLNIISHEIRTPLNGIIGPLELVRKKVASDDLDRLLLMLETSVKRLERFTMTALHITRLKVRNMQPASEQVDLVSLFKKCTEQLNDQINGKQIRVRTTVPAAHTTYKGDLKLLHLALFRILENAIKHSPEEGTISFSLRNEESQMEIDVKDQGKGFPDQILMQDFPLFNTGDQHIDRNMGLDLNLVKLIIEKHDGEIRFYNHENDGAGISISLPC